MIKKPHINAILAAAYIGLVVLVINTLMVKNAPEDTIFAPLTMLSLLVLSVTVMGYLFFYEPLRLHFDNQREAAVTFFLRTVGTFAIFVVLFLAVLLLR